MRSATAFAAHAMALPRELITRRYARLPVGFEIPSVPLPSPCSHVRLHARWFLATPDATKLLRGHAKEERRRERTMKGFRADARGSPNSASESRQEPGFLLPSRTESEK